MSSKGTLSSAKYLPVSVSIPPRCEMTRNHDVLQMHSPARINTQKYGVEIDDSEISMALLNALPDLFDGLISALGSHLFELKTDL